MILHVLFLLDFSYNIFLCIYTQACVGKNWERVGYSCILWVAGWFSIIKMERESERDERDGRERDYEHREPKDTRHNNDNIPWCQKYLFETVYALLRITGCPTAIENPFSLVPNYLWSFIFWSVFSNSELKIFISSINSNLATFSFQL